MKGKCLVLGLTGGIGMGKSTAAKILSGFGFPIYSADKAVHNLLMKKGEAVKVLAETFPQSFKKGAIDRKILGQLVFGNKVKLKKLETILHPLVHKKEKIFLNDVKKEGSLLAILEIPLLFETGAEKRCDFTLCVTASKQVQKARVMKRKGMTGARFNAIVKRQMSDAKKKSLADFVVDTSKGYGATKQQLKVIVEELLEA